MIKFTLMNEIKNILQNFIDWLQSEHEYKHPLLRIIPNIILNLLLVMVYFIVVFIVLYELFKIIIY